jgi:hypothetical protein
MKRSPTDRRCWLWDVRRELISGRMPCGAIRHDTARLRPRQVRPVPPIVVGPQVLATHLAAGVLFDPHRQVGGAGPLLIHHVSQMAHGRLHALGEGLLAFLVERHEK